MQKFPPSGIRNGIDFVEYWRNGSTPRRDRWTRRVVTVEHATITVQVAPRILTHSRILANKTYDLCRGRLNRFSDLRTDDARVGNVFPYRAWPHRFQEVARLKPKTSMKFWKSAQASFVLTILFINSLHALPPIWKQLRAGHHMFDHSGGGRANA